MDVIDHLIQEHRQAEQLMADLADTEPGEERRRLVGELGRALGMHMAVEERFLYPLVLQVVGTEDEQEAEVEHRLARQGLATLGETVDQPGFGAALDMLKAGIAHHVHEEETDVFPDLRRRAADRLAELDPDELEAQIDPRDLAQPIIELSRDQLAQRARDAGIAVDADMSRDDLVAALAEG